MKTAAVLLVAVMTVSVSQANEAERANLRGVIVFVVDVDSSAFDAEPQRYGLGEEDLRIHVESKLRQAGVRVMRKQEIINDSSLTSWAILHIDIAIYCRTGSPCASRVEVSVHERAILPRTGIFYPSVTWKTGKLGSVSKEYLRQIRDMLDDNVDEFINDYLAVNPKR